MSFFKKAMENWCLLQSTMYPRHANVGLSSTLQQGSWLSVSRASLRMVPQASESPFVGTGLDDNLNLADGQDVGFLLHARLIFEEYVLPACLAAE